MSKTITKVQIDPKTGDGYIDLKNFKEIVDITKVHSYKITNLNTKQLSIIFYDKEGNVLKNERS
jgi:hypothetical protein